ncbi:MULTISPECIES: nitroreductase family protein [unclassified Rhodococcus (in: high G+C Gram-positive bacteria)]|uniref:nitroreductase family protein n=1 Tax=unclassified Rhodococcus (in: high G+C Gram-positive bacteria) TaxID=192944 RepID=UPI0014466728|nr:MULTISPECIES: nitroreductase family protein [unclassified Rhodococcus (in: high G+C Gram-positive bacteria)]
MAGWAYRVVTIWSFGREIASFRAGQVHHMEQRKESAELYSLRRHIHMIEKGLVMRPRRPVFAEAYIEETVAAFDHLALSEFDNSSEEFNWFVSVLASYFSAVSSDSSLPISRARKTFEARFDESALDRFVDSRSSPFSVGSISVSTIDPIDFQRLLFARSSVRWFLDKTVPREALDRASFAASESPSACNRQPYRIVLLDDRELVSVVSKIPGGTAGYSENIPCLAVFIGDLSAFSEERDRHLIYIDASLAAMSFILALEVEGLATCCINWPDVAFRDSQLREALNIKAYESAIMLVAIGYADPLGEVPSSRKRPLGLIRQYNDIRSSN